MKQSFLFLREHLAFRPQKYRRHTHNTNKEAETIILRLVCLLHLLFNLSIYVLFFISLPPVIDFIFRWDSGHSLCVCWLGLCLQGFLCDTYQFAFSHLAAGKASWLLICSIVSLHSPLKGFQTKPRPSSFSGDTQSYNPIIHF